MQGFSCTAATPALRRVPTSTSLRRTNLGDGLDFAEGVYLESLTWRPRYALVGGTQAIYHMTRVDAIS